MKSEVKQVQGDSWKLIFLVSMLPQHMALWVRSFACSCVKKIKKHCQLLYDIERLHLMVPINFWQDSIPFG